MLRKENYKDTVGWCKTIVGVYLGYLESTQKSLNSGILPNGYLHLAWELQLDTEFWFTDWGINAFIKKGIRIVQVGEVLTCDTLFEL